MEKDERLWLREPPAELSADEWARAFEVVSNLTDNFVDDEGSINPREWVVVFVLSDAAGRCRLEAERREPGILNRRVQFQFDNLRAQIEEIEEE